MLGVADVAPHPSLLRPFFNAQRKRIIAAVLYSCSAHLFPLVLSCSDVGWLASPSRATSWPREVLLDGRRRCAKTCALAPQVGSMAGTSAAYLEGLLLSSLVLTASLSSCVLGLACVVKLFFCALCVRWFPLCSCVLSWSVFQVFFSGASFFRLFALRPAPVLL